ncbi:hypothetical protein F7734_50800 [Scytonema sp. UIC 10036]|uniref:hypothetical protein n=1 Tax=Scytonema sp. UIC 10036 TaxID=2304196 RepID=UPI0012DA3972|nr:hypothetical protein [Scytonema sp. UIC 10036]MUH00127.1 hypothetical protein [Scytonema sp. UIC 10036]
MALSALPQPQALAQTASDFSNPCPTTKYEMSLINNATLDKLLPGDFLSSDKGWANNQQDLLVPPSFNGGINRNLSPLWRMRVTKQDAALLQVRYQLVAAQNGKLNPFNNITNPVSSGINVVSSCPEAVDTVVVEGGIKFQFQDLSNIRKGDHIGQFSVCVNRRDDENKCL